MHKITKFNEKWLEHMYTKILYYYLYKSKDTCRVHTKLFILNEETNNKKIAFIDIKNGNTEYVWGSDHKFSCFAKGNLILIISYYKLWHVTQILHIKQ